MDDAIWRPGAVTRRGVLAAGVAGALLPGAARAGGTMNPRFSIADTHEFTMQSADKIQHRFDLYKTIGIGTLRVSVDWWEQETADGVWRGARNLAYLKQAAANGFRLKMGVATISEPPGWYMTAHPDARLLNHDRTASRSDISYWYPDLHALIATKADHLFGYLAEQQLFDAIDYVFVDCGPAAEPIYPANWTLGPELAAREASFWFYDPNAQADFAPKMHAVYDGRLNDANLSWGTSFTDWSDVKIPNVGTRPGPMWNDVLIWYRNAKREFIAWQIANYQAQLQKYASAKSKLILMVPGSHISVPAWQQAIRDGAGDYSIKIMSDSEYLMSTAADTGCWLQYTGVENALEVSYLENYIKGKSLKVLMWGENGGSRAIGSDPQKIAHVISENGLYGLEYISARFVFDEDGIRRNSTFKKLSDAYASLENH